jgi:serine/threonine protein kinase
MPHGETKPGGHPVPDTRVIEDRLLSGLPVEGAAIRLGHVLVTDKIGAGGMGAVYRGHDEKLNIDVAVKVLPFHIADHDPSMIDRFVREAQVAARVDHPNLVRVYSVGEENGIHYLVSDLIDGESADDKLKREGPLGEREALQICIEAGMALAASHAEGIIHRDVKPANILIRKKDGRVKVADLGLAKSLGEEGEGNTGLTASGQVMGTPGFMSPEQATDASTVDHRTDIYALGATLYALLTAHPPFEDPQVIAVIMKVLQEAPRDPRELEADISEDTARLIMRLLAKNPDERIGTMEGAVAQMKRALDAWRPRSAARAEPTPSASADAKSDTKELPIQPPGSNAARSSSTPSSRRSSAAGRRRSSKTGVVVVAALVMLAAGAAAAVILLGAPKEEPLTARIAPSPDGERLSVELNDSLRLDLTRIEPGSLVMGSRGGHVDERPPRETRITKPYYLGITEVTRAVYARAMGLPAPAEDEALKPAALVSWNDARKFCRILSETSGRTVRLPTEAEWEYACRAGSPSAYSFGDDQQLLSAYAWYASNAERGAHAIALQEANAWGLFDMHGNVAEWCSDYYDEDAYRSSVDADPTGPVAGTERVMRGGSYLGIPDDVRSARRLKAPPDAKAPDWGFRVVVEERR